MLDDPVEFNGPEAGASAPVDEIRIGFFAPSDAAHPAGKAMCDGAQLALDIANRAGGFRGRPFRLMVRWSDDPWGSGSKEMIRLVYADRACAVIGSTGGDTTHVAEQVATKAWVPLIAPVSSDPTLTHIRIPWMFRLPPDDAAQAETLVRDGIVKHGWERIVVVASSAHDGRMADDEIVQALTRHSIHPVYQASVPTDVHDYSQIIERIQESGGEAILLSLPLDQIEPFLQRLRYSKIDCPVLMTWIPGFDYDLLSHYKPVIGVLPFNMERESDALREMQKLYRQRYGATPTHAAVYGYDAANLIIQAVHKAGTSRNAIRDALAELSGWEGMSGTIGWDNGGGNEKHSVLLNEQF